MQTCDTDGKWSAYTTCSGEMTGAECSIGDVRVTDCGKCGTHNCFGFAAKLASHLASPDDCPAMTEAARAILRENSAGKDDSPGTVYEQALEVLKQKVKAVDFKKAPALFGAGYWVAPFLVSAAVMLVGALIWLFLIVGLLGGAVAMGF